MKMIATLAIPALALLAAAPAAAQRAADLASVDVKTAVGDIGPGWVKKTTGEEGVTFVCETAECGGRGVVGIGQAGATPDYVKLVVAEPDKALKSYQYATDESMRPSGCSFKTYEVRRLSDRRVEYDSKGECKGGGAAAMSTIFDADRMGMMSVQVLTGTEANALKLRDESLRKLLAALDAATPAKAQ